MKKIKIKFSFTGKRQNNIKKVLNVHMRENGRRIEKAERGRVIETAFLLLSSSSF